jgi:integral membrane protein
MNPSTPIDPKSPPGSAEPTLPTTLRWLRLSGILEGLSTLTLFGIAMPLKYAAGLPLAVTVVGSLHGGLFVVYLATILVVMAVHRWPLARGLALAVAAIIPFGPFFLDRRIPAWHAGDVARGR